MKRVVITGGAGFIGGHLTDALLRRGWRVTAFDNFDPYYPRALKEARLAVHRGRPGFAFTEGDARDGAAIGGVLAGAEALVHLAARPGVRASISAAGTYVDANVRGTARTLAAAAAARVRRVVFASSSSVYGMGRVPFGEDTTPARPASPYAATKRAGELLCARFVERTGARAAVVRLFSVYGPGQRPDQAIHRFATRLARGEAVECYGDGSVTRDWTHVDDAVRGLCAALAWTSHGPPACEVVNIGAGRDLSVARVIEVIGEGLAMRPMVLRRSEAPGDVPATLADVRKATWLLGYRPRVCLEDGISGFLRSDEVRDARESRAAS